MQLRKDKLSVFSLLENDMIIWIYELSSTLFFNVTQQNNSGKKLEIIDRLEPSSNQSTCNHRKLCFNETACETSSMAVWTPMEKKENQHFSNDIFTNRRDGQPNEILASRVSPETKKK